MPIEIRELVIKAVVSEATEQNRVNEMSSGAESGGDQASEQVEDLTRYILEVIREHKNER